MLKEKLLSDLWTEVLGNQDKPASRTDRFFNSGGDSMIAMTLVALARYRGFTLTVVDIFNHPILSSMADMANIVQALDHEVGLLKEETQDANIFNYKAYSFSTL